MKNFREAFRNDDLKPEFLQRLWGMLTTRPTPKVGVRDHNAGPLMNGCIQDMTLGDVLGIKPFIIKQRRPQFIEGHTFQKPCWNNPIGIDVITLHINTSTTSFYQIIHDACSS
jgi:hypothetical protein